MCQILTKCHRQSNNQPIQVVRIRGNTSKTEQNKSQIKYQFAEIDQAVRRKTRQYIQQWLKKYYQYYYLWMLVPCIGVRRNRSRNDPEKFFRRT
jgi:hypothetical protein